MADERTDWIAREAARRLGRGEAADVRQAIRLAAEALGRGEGPLPPVALVREHARGMAMEALGEAGYREAVCAVWHTAEEIMTLLEEALPSASTVLAGRAARGQIDGGVKLHLRVYTTSPMREVVEALVAHGYEEPVFQTVATRFGRLDRVCFREAGRAVLLTRCPPPGSGPRPAERERGRDLFTGRPVTVASLAQLRRRLGRG